ncbi:50S ribosomal protein L1 [Olea europaea subsp. europaea]|uniref:CL1 n=1 Tax=Olea europaea subsp. europaea TaxID=158383 RepID=A0A8S0QZT0_OLEEU|nr:50S ribosomal protein L1 [Olea europaea subsp. europaea]
MAAFKHLFSQTQRHYFSKTPPQHNLSSLILRRLFSAEPDPDANPNFRKPLPIQPVSYPTRNQPPQSQETQSQSQPESPPEQISPQADPGTRTWTRDEMRYIKDAPVISPVSYPSRVAPLPEDRVKAEEEGSKNESDELETERRRIDDERWNAMMTRRRVLGEEQEDDDVAFPTLIKVENDDSKSKKKRKVIYDLKEAIRAVKGDNKRNFDETLEAHVKMTPELRRTDLKLSGFVRLPHGFGKTYRVAVFAEGAAADEARDAGADIVGGPELVESLRSGEVKINFDKCIATPSMMEHVKKLSKNLKQLMPDAKKGTVTNDISKTVKDAKAQSVIFKKDKTAIVHVGLGKVSFSEEALRENVGAFVNALLLAKPAGLKKSSKYAGYVDSFHICSTMGRSFHISIQSLSMAADRYNRLQLQ